MEKESQLWKSVSARESLFSLDPRSIGYGSIDPLSSISGGRVVSRFPSVQFVVSGSTDISDLQDRVYLFLLYEKALK